MPQLYDVDADTAELAIQSFLGKRYLQNYAITLAVRYLYDADSPLEDEEMLLKFFKAADFSILDAENLYCYDMISKNRIGTQATDFEFDTREGKIYRLKDVDSEHILLIFFDPECPHCKDVLGNIGNNERIYQMIKARELSVLLIYTEGNNDVWEKHKWNYPQEWIVGTDCSGIGERDLYDLKVMPLIYVIGKNRIIEGKEVDIKAIQRELIGRMPTEHAFKTSD